MAVCYNKLWKLLIDRNVSKTDLAELTGLSSRIIAKLSKNETVTTETLAKICSVLNCDVCEIMECKQEKTLSLYNYFRKYGKLLCENENTKKFVFSRNEKDYTVFVSKKRAGKGTIIDCKENGTINWIQLYPFGGRAAPSVVDSVLIKPIKEKNENMLVIIKGRPNFQGLDDGIFVSSKNKSFTDKSVFVMSETAFKVFEI